jgi:hypothetical protein
MMLLLVGWQVWFIAHGLLRAHSDEKIRLTLAFTRISPLYNKSLGAQKLRSRLGLEPWLFRALKRLATATRAERVAGFHHPDVGVRPEGSYADVMTSSRKHQ